MAESEDLIYICDAVENDEDFRYPIREPKPFETLPILEWAELVIR